MAEEPRCKNAAGFFFVTDILSRIDLASAGEEKHRRHSLRVAVTVSRHDPDATDRVAYPASQDPGRCAWRVRFPAARDQKGRGPVQSQNPSRGTSVRSGRIPFPG